MPRHCIAPVTLGPLSVTVITDLPCILVLYRHVQEAFTIQDLAASVHLFEEAVESSTEAFTNVFIK